MNKEVTTSTVIIAIDANVPDTPNWDGTKFSEELDLALEEGVEVISTPDGNKYRVNSRDSVTGITEQDTEKAQV